MAHTPAPDYAGLIERLEEGARDLHPYSMGEIDSPSLNVALPAYLNDAAKAIRDLEADNARLRSALEPFKLAADNMDGDEPDGLTIWESPEAMSLVFGDLRKARAALSGRDGG